MSPEMPMNLERTNGLFLAIPVRRRSPSMCSYVTKRGDEGKVSDGQEGVELVLLDGLVIVEGVQDGDYLERREEMMPTEL